MTYRYIDTHAHLNIGAFAEDAAAVAKRCAEDGIAVINVGTKRSTSERAVELAQEHENCCAVIGLHPIQTTPEYHDTDELGEGSVPFLSKGEEFDTEAFRTMASHQKVVAIGECGFDYYRNAPDTYELQEAAFIAQIELANELGLPLMIHTRDAAGNQASANATGRSVYDDVYEVLAQHAKVPGNIHFYAGTWEQAKRFFDIGFTVSFTGVVTFAKDYEEVVKNAPLSMLHAETDCPYVAPKPYRGKRCEPWMVVEIYKKMAEIRGEDEENVRVQLLENARKLYNL